MGQSPRYEVRLSSHAERDLDDLTTADFRRVDIRIQSLAGTPRPRGTQKLGDTSYRDGSEIGALSTLSTMPKHRGGSPYPPPRKRYLPRSRVLINCDQWPRSARSPCTGWCRCSRLPTWYFRAWCSPGNDQTAYLGFSQQVSHKGWHNAGTPTSDGLAVGEVCPVGSAIGAGPWASTKKASYTRSCYCFGHPSLGGAF